MASTYSTSLRLELIGTGDQSGTWGTTTNTNLGTLLEQAVTGVSNVSMTSDADYTLTTVNGGTDQARQAVLNITSTVSLTATRNIIIPSVNKVYIVKNGTSGSQSLTIKTSSGTGITVKNGYTTAVYCNGTNVYQAIDYLPSVTIDNVLFTDVLGVGSAAVNNVNAYLNTDLSSSSTSQYGLLVNTTPSSSATSAQYGVLSDMQGSTGSSGSPYTTSQVHGLRASAYVPGTYQTVTTQYGVSVANQDGSGPTFNYAFYSNNSGSSSVSLSSISRASNVVSVATATSHGLAVGDTVVISSATSSFNGVFTVTTAGTSTTFQYNQTGSNETGTASQGYSTKANNWNYYSASSAPSYFNGPAIISASSGMDGLRITQAGSGNALVVEDSTNPDSTPFVIDSVGAVISGYTAQIDTYRLQIVTSNGVNQSNYRFSADTGGPIVKLSKSRSGTIGTNSIVSSGDSIGSIRYFGADGTDYIEAVRIEGAIDGTPGTNDMPGRLVFSTTADGASSVTERMRIDSSGNLLIGTTTPRVFDSSTFTVTPSVQNEGTDANGSSSSLMRNTASNAGPVLFLGKSRSGALGGVTIVQSGDQMGQIIFEGTDGTGLIEGASIRAEVDGTPGTNDMPGRLVFNTTADGASSPTERVRIDSSGNIIVGSSTSYDAKTGSSSITPRLQIQGTSLGTSSVGQYGWNSNPYLTFNKSAGSIGTYTAVASGDALGQIQFNGTDGAGFFIAARIQSLADATPSTGIVPGRLSFQTTDSTGLNYERMRIASTGQVNIGTQGASNINDIIQIGDANTNIGIVTATTISGIALRYDAPTTATATQRGLYVAYNGGDSASPYTTTAVYGGQFVTYTKGTNQTVTNAYGVYIDNVTAGSTTNYALYVAAPSGATTNYGLVVSGASATNYIQGSLGVGTTTPDTKLHVYESTGATLTVEANNASAIYVKRHSTDSSPAYSYLYKSRGTYSSPTAVTSGDSVGVIYFTAYGGTNDRNIAYVSAGVDTYTSDSNISGRLSFATSPSGSATATEHMRLDQEGCLYIEDSLLWQYQPAHTAKSAAATLTAAELKTSIIVGTGTSYTLTMPTGTNIDAAFTGVPTTSIGFDFYVVNGASGTITMAVNTGVTNVGGLTIGAGNSAHFRLRRSAANTYVMYRLS